MTAKEIDRIDAIDITKFIFNIDKNKNMANKAYLIPSAVTGIAIFNDFIGIRLTSEEALQLKNDPLVISLLNKYFKLD